eukprot:IDg9074t1
MIERSFATSCFAVTVLGLRQTDFNISCLSRVYCTVSMPVQASVGLEIKFHAPCMREGNTRLSIRGRYVDYCSNGEQLNYGSEFHDTETALVNMNSL